MGKYFISISEKLEIENNNNLINKECRKLSVYIFPNGSDLPEFDSIKIA